METELDLDLLRVFEKEPGSLGAVPHFGAAAAGDAPRHAAQGGQDGSHLLFAAPVWAAPRCWRAAEGPAPSPYLTVSFGLSYPLDSPRVDAKTEPYPQPVDPPRDDRLGGGDRPGAAGLAVGGRPVRRQQAPEGGGRMKQGVILCGLNGSGKSTLGRALAQRLGWEFLDIEDCFLPQDRPQLPLRQPTLPPGGRGPFGGARHRRGKLCAGQRQRPLPRAGAAAHRGRCGCGWTRPPGPGGCGSAPMRSSGSGWAPGATCSSRRRRSSPLPPSGRTARWRPGWPRYAAPWWRWTALCPSRRRWSGWPAAFPAHKTQVTSRRGAFRGGFCSAQKQGRQKLPALFRGKI